MRKRILIIGGGFAGINVIRKLANNKSFDITLVDKNNYHFFPPLIYQVSSCLLEPSAISYPFRRFIRNKKNIHFRMAELKSIVPEQNKVILSNGELGYDILIFATGTESNYFGMSNLEKYSLPMKTLNDALLLRNTLLNRFEAASRTADLKEQEKLLNIVIAGGGPSGVEISGVLCEIVNHTIFREFPEFRSKVTINLIEGSPDLLGPMSDQSHEESLKRLTTLGVKVMLNTRVKDCTEESIIFIKNGKEDKIDTKTIIWTAGVTSKVFDGIPKEVYVRGRRMQVNEFNKVQGFKNIYAIGDTCIMNTDGKFPEGHPQLAQVAIQQGKRLAENLKNEINSQKMVPFTYIDKGSMAVIGRNKAVADIATPKIFLQGFIAWLVWSLIHIMSLISTGNRLNTFYRWVTVYFTNSSALRLDYKIGEKGEI